MSSCHSPILVSASPLNPHNYNRTINGCYNVDNWDMEFQWAINIILSFYPVKVSLVCQGRMHNNGAHTPAELVDQKKKKTAG